MIYLVRHTKPEVAAGVCYGQSDVPLANTFTDELSAVKEKISLPLATAVFSSPLQRCVKLAHALFDESQVQLDQRLLEMHFGDWEMQAWDEVDQEKLSYWGDNFVTMPSPNGESLECVQQRVLRFWNELDHLNRDYALVTHSGVIRVILAHLLESPLAKAFTLNVHYGEVIRVDFIDHDNCTVKFM